MLYPQRLTLIWSDIVTYKHVNSCNPSHHTESPSSFVIIYSCNRSCSASLHSKRLLIPEGSFGIDETEHNKLAFASVTYFMVAIYEVNYVNIRCNIFQYKHWAFRYLISDASHTPGNVQFYIVITWETPGNHWCWWPNTLIITLATARAIIKVSGHQHQSFPGVSQVVTM